MFLCQVYGVWISGWIYEEGEKVFVQLDIVYKGKQDGVCDKKVMPSTACLEPSCSQTWALASGNVEQCARSLRAARDLTETTLVSWPVTPKPACPIPSWQHSWLYFCFLYLKWGAASWCPDRMSPGERHEVWLKQWKRFKGSSLISQLVLPKIKKLLLNEALKCNYVLEVTAR